jgi:hypothetical protein
LRGLIAAFVAGREGLARFFAEPDEGAREELLRGWQHSPY